MPIQPLITFKAGICEVDQSSKPHTVKPTAKKGYIYLYNSSDDELTHFCWRERGAPLDQPELDLVTIPTDCHFIPYENRSEPTARTNGRLFVLKFSSSPARHLFWLQSKPQARNGDPSWFSPRDLKIGQIVDDLLQGEDVDVQNEIAQVEADGQNDDDDETMEDIEGHGDPNSHHRAGSGGAGPDATGGDVREEGESAREGGADGGRAAAPGASEAALAVQNFLNSLKGNPALGGASQTAAEGKLYTSLPDLLETSVTVPTIDSATPEQIDNLLTYLPPTVLLLSQESADQIDGMVEPTPATTQAAIEAMSQDQKKSLLKRVLRSPQFHQSLGSLTVALRDGGLPMVADALGIQVAHGGLVRGGSVPLGGGEAVEAFVEGVKKSVEAGKK